MPCNDGGHHERRHERVIQSIGKSHADYQNVGGNRDYIEKNPGILKIPILVSYVVGEN